MINAAATKAILLLGFFIGVCGACTIPSEWYAGGKRWRVSANVFREFSRSGLTVDRQNGAPEIWNCEAADTVGSNWAYLILSNGGERYCHRVYLDKNYIVFWRATNTLQGNSTTISQCVADTLYKNDSPQDKLDIMTAENIVIHSTQSGCLSRIEGLHYAQVSLSDQRRNICPADHSASQVDIGPSEIVFNTCRITGRLRCIGSITPTYIGDSGSNTIVIFQNMTTPNTFYCARLRWDSVNRRTYISIDYTARDRLFCDTEVNPETARTSPDTFVAFNLMRVYCFTSPRCANGATCIEDEGFGYKCLCPPGFNGLFCNHQLHCHESPCMNAGRCVDAGEYRCECANGYAGAICEKPACVQGTKIDPDVEYLCLICPIGTYQPDNLATSCIDCPTGTTTQEVKRTVLADCVPDCPPGEFIHIRDSESRLLCRKCPLATYQPQRARNECILCSDGYTTTQLGSTSIDQCILINPCDSNPCVGGATCHADVTGFKCACPDFKGGLYCQIDTVPEILSIEPQFGPIAGGTIITIRGTNLQGDSEISLYLENLQCTVLSRNETTILIQTPEHDPKQTDFTQESFDISFDYTPSYDVPLSYQYTYLPNPVVNDVQNLKTIAMGGSPVKGVGHNMDSVAKPHVLVTLIYKNLILETVPKTALIITERYTGPCFYSNGTSIGCTVPELTLPEEIDPFINGVQRKKRDVTNKINDVINQHGRQKRNNENIRVFQGCDATRKDLNEVEFYVDFLLDGLTTVHEERELCVFEDPELEHFDPAVRKFKKNERLVIKGDNMDLGISEMHYAIDIGEGQCDDLELLSNTLSCSPPDSMPEVNKTGSYKENAPRVIIRYGENFRFHAGYLQYPVASSILVPVIAASCGFVVLVIILIIVLCRCLKNRKKKPAKVHAIQANGVLAVNKGGRKDSSNNPLYAPNDDNNNAVFVAVNGSNTVNGSNGYAPNSRMRQNSIYETQTPTLNTPFRFPSTSSDNTEESLSRRNLIQNGQANGHVAPVRKFSVPDNHRKSSLEPNAGLKSRSATMPSRKSKPLTKKESKSSIKEGKRSKRFTRADSMPNANDVINDLYAGDVFIEEEETENPALRVKKNKSLSKKEHKSAIKEGKHSKRFTRSDSTPCAADVINDLYVGDWLSKTDKQKSMRNKMNKSLSKKEQKAMIKEGKNSKRFTRSDSMPDAYANTNESYVRPVFLVDGPHKHVVDGASSVRAHFNGRSTAPYTVL